MGKLITFSADEVDRDGFITPGQVAKKTTLSLSTIYKEIAAGRLPAYKLTDKIVLKAIEVEAWVQRKAIKISRTTPRSKRGKKRKMIRAG